ncbi:hypothetical protein KL86DES1_20343 [uncultured Desulfovibrio sp.]|uniref:Uncharacterized protein n=1 Tax=uncultured Desulfovibrio sp. TaxID=167968 RepID=A0A212L384_9BACT|nr:hypothetical protein KL86DES1_20343 [uncultured Desulfovibrio sp.]VZH33245.1 conserved protein of unknown function [Desulfovibrio sp. 86]
MAGNGASDLRRALQNQSFPGDAANPQAAATLLLECFRLLLRIRRPNAGRRPALTAGRLQIL